MNNIKNVLIVLSLAVVSISCKDITDSKVNDSQNKEEAVFDTNTDDRNVEIEKIKNRLCKEFPKKLVMVHNPIATRLDIESIDDGSGGTLGCKLKLFYGEKDYEYWAGEVSAWVNQMEDPFWQYNPERNATLYQNIEGFGDKAVYIANMYQLLILKEGIMYSIVPPNKGRTTDTGKENKEIAIEIAKHYQL